MEKRKKKVNSLILALLMVFGLCACGAEERAQSSAPKIPDLMEVMQEANEKLADVKSMSYEFEMDLEMGGTIGGENNSIVMKIGGTADSITSPMAMKMDMTMDMGELGKYDTINYYQEEDGKCAVYTGINMGEEKMYWIKQTMGSLAAMKQYNAKDSFGLYLSCMEEFQDKGAEEIAGTKAVRYDGVIPKEALNKVLQSAGMQSYLSAVEDGSKVQELLKDMGNLPMSIWIAEDTGLPVHYEMDMTEMLQNMMGKITDETDGSASADNVTISRVYMSMTITGVDNVKEIVLPEEAKEAQEMTGTRDTTGSSIE